jgi:predicted MFS family arabinose efflux permease
MEKNNSLPITKFTSYQVLVIVLLALTQFTVVLDFMVMSPLGDMLMKSMALTPEQFSICVLSYAISAGVSGLLTAGFADRFDRQKLLLFFYIGFIAGTVFCGLANSYALLVAARIFTGIFGGVIGSIGMAIVADLFLLQQRGRVMGFMQMGFGASQVLGIPISLALANKWGWQMPFFMIVGLAIIIWMLIMLKMQPVNKHLELQNERNAFKHLWNTVKQRHYRIGFLSTALLSLGGFLMMPWGSTFSRNNLNVSEEGLVVLFAVSGVFTLLIMPVIGKLSDKFDKMKLFVIASIWLMVTALVYTNLVPMPLWAIILVNVLLMMGVMSRIVPAVALVSALPEMKDRGAFMSVNSSLQQIAGGIAAGIGGMIIVRKDEFSPIENYNVLGYIIVVLSVIGIFMLARVNNLLKKNSTTEASKPEGEAVAH